MKYIYKFNSPYDFYVHRTELGKHDLFEQKLNFLKWMHHYYKKSLWKIKRHWLKRQNTTKDWIHKHHPFDSQYADESEFYFFHFSRARYKLEKIAFEGNY